MGRGEGWPANPKRPGAAGDEPVALSISTRCETTAKFGSNDPDDPVDGTVNQTITEWLAAGNKADWKSDFGLDSPALGDAEDEIESAGYGKDLFLTGLETKARGIDPHRKQILPHRGMFDNSEGILENTISAAANAFKYGFHGVELDLRADKNGHAWMMHDTTLGRVTGDPNNCLISDVSTEEIKNMNLSIWNPITSSRTLALDRNGNPQKMEDLQSIIDYIREKKETATSSTSSLTPRTKGRRSQQSRCSRRLRMLTYGAASASRSIRPMCPLPIASLPNGTRRPPMYLMRWSRPMSPSNRTTSST
ncbi:glycerophosphodiester phosphodiesterase family protein (plasmid) [Rhizobium beringeri]|nr:glycerophosphodiester phosphodiesterase family protein [Rhizobium beringeri]WSH18597.1 glycerophosphodiester phosphodiesterase family protein [Rhizobium beringeri]